MRHYRLTSYFLLIAASIMLLTACGKTEYSNVRVYFVFDNSVHLDQTLAPAMDPVNSSIFCRVYRIDAGHIGFENNQGQKSKVMMSAIERQGNTMLGIYNESGVIVGYGFTSVGGDMHEFYAYDAQCPNCYKEFNMPRYMLTLNSDGTAYCNKCKRTYSLKNGGITDNGEKLLRYRATSTGPNGILAINN